MNVIKKFLSVALIGSMLLCFASCSGIKKINKVDEDDLVEIVADELDISEADVLKNKLDLDGASGFGLTGDVNILFVEYEKDSAKNAGSQYIDSIRSGHEESKFTGTYKKVKMSSSGYYVYNGTKKDVIGDDEKINDYGGVYYSGNCVYRIYTSKDSSKETVDAIINKLGFPTP